MNWDAIGAIGETISALAVVVSILYLSIQIRSNTRATKASASFDATHSWATSNEQVPQFSDELLGAFSKSYDSAINESDFSEIENIRLGAHNRALFQKLEGQYYLYKYGYLEPSVWKKRSEWAHGLIQLPYYQKWWDSEIRESIYSDEFAEAILSSSAIQVSMPGVSEKET
ncbi:MAG: hypothetical protein ACI80L_001405 [Pseudohongiellaceae bacterium]|jgi:hypothetical protein